LSRIIISQRDVGMISEPNVGQTKMRTFTRSFYSF